MQKSIFTSEQEKLVKISLGMILAGRNKVVEDLSKEISETMFPLTEEQIKGVNATVEAFVYGGGVQEKMEFPERIQLGLDYVKQKLLM